MADAVLGYLEAVCSSSMREPDALQASPLRHPGSPLRSGRDDEFGDRLCQTDSA
jgi:hypothetical protein